MTRIVYFDCFSGCSGDMILGALLDAGLDLNALEKGLAGLKISSYRLSAQKVQRSSITATKFNVVVDESHSTEEHRLRRTLADILKIIDSSPLPDQVKRKSKTIFQRLGEVEGKIHGVPVEQVHFHEIGAVDSIIDIVGTVLAFDMLKIERFYSSPLPLGSGHISAAHGILPSPAPATLQLLAAAGAPVISAPEPAARLGELVTPTGALLVTSLAVFQRPAMRIDKVGYGAGGKDIQGWPNVLRIWLGDEGEEADTGELILLETNIDDMNPQIYGYLMEKLMAQKAADVWFTPIQMKKNRPAIMLSVLAPANAEAQLTEIIMKETSTLGIRTRPVSRHIAQREIIEIDSSLGRVRAKVKSFGSGLWDVSPEYEDCRRIALERNMPLREVSRIIEMEARRYLTSQI